MEAKDLRERLAKALGREYKVLDGYHYWQIRHEGEKHDWQEFKIGWSIVPVVLADIEARKWFVSLEWQPKAVGETGREWRAEVMPAFWPYLAYSGDSLPVALVTAYLAARDATE